MRIFAIALLIAAAGAVGAEPDELALVGATVIPANGRGRPRRFPTAGGRSTSTASGSPLA